MPKNNLKNCLVDIDGADYTYNGHVAGRIHLMNAATGAPFVAPQPDGTVALIDDAQFEQLLLEGRAVVKRIPSGDPTRRLNDCAQWTIDQANAIDPKVGKMLAQIEMLDAAGVQNGTKAVRNHLKTNWGPEQIAKFGPHDNPHSVRRWRAHRGRPGARHPRHMVRMSGRVPRGAYGAGVPAEVAQKHALENWATRDKVRSTHANYVAEMVSINAGTHPDYQKPDTPYRIASEDTIRRRINRLESDATDRSKRGDQAVEQDWRGAGRPLTADFAMQRVIIDHTRLDLFVVDDERDMVLGRPWLTLAIDVRTRAIVAYLLSFVDPSVWTVGEILRRMVLPKRPPSAMAERYPILVQLRGKPHQIIVDNAVEFRSHTMEAAARSAGFSVRFCPLGQPRYRAIGERPMGTINRLICEEMAGRVLPPKEARRLGYDPEKQACCIMLELEAVANQGIAEYNTGPQDGLNGRQPALAFERDANSRGIDNFADLESFRLDTMAIQPAAQLSPSGIRAFGSLRYHHIQRVPELLNDLRPVECRRQRRDDATATVDFRYDPMDISRIHVWNRVKRTYVELVCDDLDYADGMPLSFHEQIRAAAKAEGATFNTKEERLLARSRRIQAIRAIDPDEKARVRKAVAELYEIPRLRQITGNIVHLRTEPPQPVTVAEFISHDRAALTALDTEILSPRSPISESRRKGVSKRRDTRNAGSAKPATSPGEAAPRRRGASLRGDAA